MNHLNNHPLPHRTHTQTTILQIYGVSISINKYSSMFIIVTQIRTFLFNLQGFMIVDRSPLYGSRGMLDQHRDMRLDIDNMTYEVIITFQCLLHFDLFVEIVGSWNILNDCSDQELLALGERIGSVSTGLSEDLISRCLTESIYCSADQMQEEGNCVICLVRTRITRCCLKQLSCN